LENDSAWLSEVGGAVLADATYKRLTNQKNDKATLRVSMGYAEDLLERSTRVREAARSHVAL
jgi:hypothetical protein